MTRPPPGPGPDPGPDAFLARIPALPEADLRRYLARPEAYRTEAVEAAAAELARRGQALGEPEWAALRARLAGRDRLAEGEPHPGWRLLLGRDPGARTGRIRRLTGGLLAAGLGSAAAVYLTALPPAANPLGYEPENTKRYLRDLELYGGKVNVLATELRRGFDALWHGRNLAYTLAVLTVLLAGAFWFIATRVAEDLGPAPGEGGPGS